MKTTLKRCIHCGNRVREHKAEPLLVADVLVYFKTECRTCGYKEQELFYAARSYWEKQDVIQDNDFIKIYQSPPK